MVIMAAGGVRAYFCCGGCLGAWGWGYRRLQPQGCWITRFEMSLGDSLGSGLAFYCPFLLHQGSSE